MLWEGAEALGFLLAPKERVAAGDAIQAAGQRLPPEASPATALLW